MPMAARHWPGYRQAHTQRQQLVEITAQLVTAWRDRADDPFMMEVLRGLALAQSIDDARPIDRHGQFRRWRCTRQWWWPFAQRQCSTRVTLRFCRTADTVTLWFHVLNHLPNTHISLATVRTWLTQCQENKPQD